MKAAQTRRLLCVEPWRNAPSFERPDVDPHVQPQQRVHLPDGPRTLKELALAEGGGRVQGDPEEHASGEQAFAFPDLDAPVAVDFDDFAGKADRLPDEPRAVALPLQVGQFLALPFDVPDGEHGGRGRVGGCGRVGGRGRFCRRRRLRRGYVRRRRGLRLFRGIRERRQREAADAQDGQDACGDEDDCFFLHDNLQGTRTRPTPAGGAAMAATTRRSSAGEQVRQAADGLAVRVARRDPPMQKPVQHFLAGVVPHHPKELSQVAGPVVAADEHDLAQDLVAALVPQRARRERMRHDGIRRCAGKRPEVFRHPGCRSCD